MVSKNVNLVHDLLTDPAHSQTPVRVPMHRFQEFTRQFDRDLDKLVAQWIHQAAPQALRRVVRPR